jgi:adenine deaminase
VQLLIRNARIDDRRPPIDIGIERGRIVALEEHVDTAAETVIDAERRAVLPGWMRGRPVALHFPRLFRFLHLIALELE